MKITYTSITRAHHYAIARGLHQRNLLEKYICGFPRSSPRAALPELGNQLIRKDTFSTLFFVSRKLNLPPKFDHFLYRKALDQLDCASYPYASCSDLFLYYRTTGLKTTTKLKKQNSATVCVMEEVNSHVENYEEIIKREFARSSDRKYFNTSGDYDRRLRNYEVADYILCPSTFVIDSFLERGFDNSRLLKAPFGCDLPKNFDFEQALALREESEKFVILYVGQVNIRKGVKYLIEAFKQLEHPNKELRIVGPMTSNSGLDKTSIPEGVVFTGSLKGQELIKEYTQAQVFVLPTLEEGMALVQGEAVGFGLPLITTTNSGGSDIITNQKEGFIIPPSDAVGIADKIQLLIDDSTLRRDMSKMARNLALSMGGWESSIEKLIEILETIQRK